MTESISYALNGKYGIGKNVLLSLDDYENIKGRSLCCISSGYIIIWNKETNKAEYLHRWLFGLKKGDKSVVDHIDHNLLNCTRQNLRLCTTSENMMNRKKCDINGCSPSKYKGVRKVGNRWLSMCQKDKIKYQLGTFETEIEAAEAYNKKAIELHQGYALLNIIN